MRSARRGPAADAGGSAGGRRGLGPRCPRLGPRQEARRPATRPNRLRARRLPARPPASPDAPGTPCSRGPWALPRAWPGEGRWPDTRVAVAWAAPHGSRGETEADWGVRTAGLSPAGGGGGPGGKVNPNSPSRKTCSSEPPSPSFPEGCVRGEPE